MRYRTVSLIVISVLALGLSSHAVPARPERDAAKEEELRAAMRKLWEDHITWTRLFIISALADLPDKEATTARLLQNQVDIGNAIKPFYGDPAGDQLTALLKDHILIAADIVAAAKAGDTAKVEADKARWTANADQIAVFLSAANPENWSESDLKAMLHQHLEVTTEELTARLNSDWDADVAAYEKVHAQALEMADALSDGIIRQFPDKV